MSATSVKVQVSAAAPTQGANSAPSGGSAAVLGVPTANVGVHS